MTYFLDYIKGHTEREDAIWIVQLITVSMLVTLSLITKRVGLVPGNQNANHNKTKYLKRICYIIV